MIEVRKTSMFSAWMANLRDRRAVARIDMRIARLALGHFGDVKFFDNIGEMRIDYGPGYRVYFVKRGAAIVILLCGGDKSSQSRDISTALTLAQDV